MNNSYIDIIKKNVSFATFQEGFNLTTVKGVYCLKFLNNEKKTKRTWMRSLALVVQGHKEITLGQSKISKSAGHYIISPIELPVISRTIMPAIDRPYLGLIIDLDPSTIFEVAQQTKFPSKKHNELAGVAIVSREANTAILEAFARLTNLFHNADDAHVLGPLIMKEIYYHLLRSPEGQDLYDFMKQGSNLHKISEAVQRIRLELDKSISVSKLAASVNMSRATFFKWFKAATSMSPIQYQKRLRLIEGRRLIGEQKESAEKAAFKVGYNSSSQFNREYSRMFGHPPIRHSRTKKAQT